MRRVRRSRARRPRLKHLPAAIREADWLDRLVSGGLVACALAIVLAWWHVVLPDAWDGVRATIWGVPGSVAVACEESTAAEDPQFWTLGWSCTGPFTSDAGDLRIDSVHLFTHGDEPPGPTVAGRVSGPGATWMWPDGEIEWVFAVALAVGVPVLPGYLLFVAVTVLEPSNGWPRPRRKPRLGPAQMGNRARRRRKRRQRRTADPMA
ncbi:hypothetical protein ACFY2Q_09510 [Micromonospora sp. NPDC000316]|uniref:hypothetical protein n=1 Tax=Micromonospora sp. NPDC000316 TaxID=3364216 RepID=UPI0036B67A55